MKAAYPECAWAIDGTMRVLYRFVCRYCGAQGEYRDWLSEAEHDGDVHGREQHGEGKASA